MIIKMKMFQHILESSFIVMSMVVMTFDRIEAQHKKNDVLLEVQGITIGKDEFVYRLNFVPHLNEYDADSIKKERLSASIIAEKIFALEAIQRHFDTLGMVQLAQREFQKEAIYEQWMEKEVAEKVRYTNAEVVQAYRRFVEQRVVAFLVFLDSSSASLTQAQLRKGGDIDQCKTSDGTPLAQTKTIEYGESLQQVEDQIYLLKPNQISNVIFADGKYYIFKLKRIEPHPTHSKQNFLYWKPSVEKRLKARKELICFSEAADRIMASKQFIIDRSLYEFVLNEVAKRIPFGKKEFLELPEAANREFAIVPDDVHKHFNEPLLRFRNKEVWTIGDLWEKLRLGPYLLNYRSKEDLTNGFSHLIRTMVVFETVVENGRARGWDHDEYVQEQTRMWSDDLLSKLYQHSLLDTMNVNDEEVFENYQKNKDRYLQPETRRVLELLVSDRKLAEKLVTQIQAGEDMQNLVRRYSIRSTREQDAAQGVLLTKNTWGKIGEVVFSLPVGGLYGPIDLDSNRFSIVRLQEIINNGHRPFEDVRREVKEEILKQKSREQTERILKENSGKYSIKINKNALKDVEALKSTMVVRKSHFPNRFAVPLTTPTDHQASWFQRIWNNQEK